MSSAIGNSIGAIGGMRKTLEGKKMQKKAQAKIDAFRFDDLKNAFEDVSVSTMGSDLRMEEAGKTTSSLVNAAREGGTRGIVGAAGQIANQQNTVARDVAAGLDQQQSAINMAKAQDDVKLRDMQEKRQTDELAGYGQMLSQGIGMKYQGVADTQASFQAQGESEQAAVDSASSSASSMGGSGGGGGGMMSMMSMFASDRRLKKNIELVGKSPSGLSIYNFEYTFKDGVWQGVMSDEIPQEAVVVNSFNTGYDAVDYSKIDVEFKQIK